MQRERNAMQRAGLGRKEEPKEPAKDKKPEEAAN